MGFGETLHGWRKRTRPGDVGIDGGTARRVTGLRRAELARLAGLSAEYVKQLEQGRASTPSAQVVGALSRALRLTPSERDHLYRAAGLTPPAGDVPRALPPGARRLVDRLRDLPVAVFAADWTLVHWNRMWSATAGDPAGYHWPYDNLAAASFLTGDPAEEIGPWPLRAPGGSAAVEVAVVADLRAVAATYPADALLASMVDEMCAASARFRELWTTGTVTAHLGQTKTVEHPVHGEILVDCEVLMVPGVDLKILTFMAEPGSPDAAKLDAIRDGLGAAW
ncbi:helix-turn-helix transcriptional regulator [Catenuloplanes indicus]|uniref:Transcriptional regulator with XRE-family HTH domain n=1 Tax=Catenuloplanes indicus TaxID=137267 RepID=A0AAE3W596_9ACTN|nr:helix-turn-helix transcriptional regulator [Catenuloplanes indicus]MDQ0370118.1 transcriptional regulator with XRE-family HTH domain [Catenuloplanes indicus]